MPIKQCNPEYLQKSIESVLKQTYTNLELLVVTDISEPDVENQSLKILEKFKKDKRLRIVLNRNNGFVEALNTGLLSARGTYIARLDGDDISLPDRLQLQVHAMKEYEADFVGGWAYAIDDQGEIVGKLTPPTDSKKIKRMIMLHNPFLHSSVIFKKSILGRTGLYNSALFGAEDYELWLRILSLGYKCINLPCFVICLREASNSIVRGNAWRKTRASYAKAKVLAFGRLGYHDPLSAVFCLTGPFSSFLEPKIVLKVKFLMRWFEKTSSDELLSLSVNNIVSKT